MEITANYKIHDRPAVRASVTRPRSLASDVAPSPAHAPEKGSSHPAGTDSSMNARSPDVFTKKWHAPKDIQQFRTLVSGHGDSCEVALTFTASPPTSC